MSNPKWTKDEMILALDLYFRIRNQSISKTHPEVVELSNIMRRLDIHSEELREDSFRNPNSISTRLSNYKSVDPHYDGTGLINGGKMVQKIWDEYCDREIELHLIAETIKESVNFYVPKAISEDEEDFPEGKIMYRLHKTRERNSKIVKEKKYDAVNAGILVCEVCGFDFEKTYGTLGRGYIECHHNKPISEYEVGQKTRKEDLSLVCANCHRMLHRKRPWIEVENLILNEGDN